MPEEPIEELKEPMLVITVKAADVKIDRIPSSRRVSGYNVFLGKCLPKKPTNVSTPEYLGICNRLWKDVSDEEKAEYRELAEIKNATEQNEESK